MMHFEWRDKLFLFNAHQNSCECQWGFGLARFWAWISEVPLYIHVHQKKIEVEIYARA